MSETNRLEPELVPYHPAIDRLSVKFGSEHHQVKFSSPETVGTECLLLNMGYAEGLKARPSIPGDGPTGSKYLCNHCHFELFIPPNVGSRYWGDDEILELGVENAATCPRCRTSRWTQVPFTQAPGPREEVDPTLEKALLHKGAVEMASEKWGECGYAWCPDAQHDYYEVGRLKNHKPPSLPEIIGRGKSWAEAFAKADQGEQK